MSDSDDDTAFASADEGDGHIKETESKESPKAKSEKNLEDGTQKEKKGTAETNQAKGATGKGKKKGKQAKKKGKNTDTPGSVEPKPEKVEKAEVVENKPKTEETKSETVEEKPDETSQNEVTKEELVKTDKDTASSSKLESLVKSPSGQNIQREPVDEETDKPDIKSVLDQLADDEDENEDEDKGKQSSWGWGGWGSSILNVAQSSMSTFTHQVGEGFNTLMDTMENTLGAIPPEELAYMKHQQKTGEVTEQPKPQEQVKEAEPDDKEKQTKEEEDKVATKVEDSEEVKEDKATGGGWFSSWGVSTLKQAVTKTTNISKTLVHGGMDVLETVGKKAFDFIEDHDPGLHKSKEVLFDRGGKPNLSQILKEAKEEADYKAEMEKESEEARKAHFGFLFDEYQGISHLEALEILSNQCEKKVQVLLSSLSAESLASIKSELIEIKQIFEQGNEDSDDDEEQEHEFIKEMTELLTGLHLGTTPDKINKVHDKIRKDITDFYEQQEKHEKVDPKTMHQKAIQSLAELTSKAMEQFHKAGELILIQKDSDKNFIDRARCLLSINKLLSTEVSILSTKFSHCLNKLGEDLEDDSGINQMVTNVYLEASNSSTYIHDGFQLLLPCLQQAAIENTPGIID